MLYFYIISPSQTWHIKLSQACEYSLSGKDCEECIAEAKTQLTYHFQRPILKKDTVIPDNSMIRL